MTTLSTPDRLNALLPPKIPKLGRFPFGVLPEFRRDPLGLYVRAMLTYGDLVCMRFGPRESYAPFHPDYFKHILVDNNKNYKRHALGNSLLKMITGETLLTSDGEFWLRQRRLMQPAFHRQRILSFGELMTGCAARMLANWEKTNTDHFLDIDKEMMRVTLSVVGLALFSVDLTTASQDLARSITASSEYFTYRLGRLLAPPLWWPTRRNRNFKAALTAAAPIVPNMIAARRKLVAEQGSAEAAGRRYDMMDLLLDARYEDTGEGMDDLQLAAEIRTFIAAGHETTSTSLSWALYLLSQHPEVETRLHAEVDNVLQGRTPTVADLPILPYTRMVIDETMRLYPAAWVIARQSIAEDQWGPYPIPADRGVVMNIFALQRNPAFWPDAERFDPERFAPERAATYHRFAFMPFGGGPRQCIGNVFALTEAHLILAMIAQRFKLRLKSGYQVIPEPLITLRIRNGLPMRLVRR